MKQVAGCWTGEGWICMKSREPLFAQKKKPGLLNMPLARMPMKQLGPVEVKEFHENLTEVDKLALQQSMSKNREGKPYIHIYLQHRKSAKKEGRQK
jgi:hypothetical protein